jgi:hypothetical protein
MALVAASLGVLLIVAEGALRSFPRLLPVGSYGAGRFDPELGLTVHAAPVIYNKIRFLVREPNREGFMDVVHEYDKPPGVSRIGFFGDSYVESIQVPLDSTFIRLLEERLRPAGAETFSFGLSGWGTLRSLMAYRVLGDRYDLNTVVYVFVENDPGDHLHALEQRMGTGGSPRPFARATEAEPGFEILWSRSVEDLPPRYWISKWIQRHVFMAQLVHSRLVLIRKQGLFARRAERPNGRSFDQDSLPSRWPPELLAEAKLVTTRVLAQFRDEVVAGGREFLVLYVPRGNEELDGGMPTGESWLPFVAETCERLEIPLLDPSHALKAEVLGGVPMYDDHWSPEGHEVIARFLAQTLCERSTNISCGRESLF